MPALISQELFEQARQRLAENKRFSPRNNKKHEYLLGGLPRYQQCGYAFMGEQLNHRSGSAPLNPQALPLRRAVYFAGAGTMLNSGTKR